MSNSTFTSRKKQLLENRKANLEARYETVFKQLDATLNESDKFTLKQQLELLELEIEEIDGALKNISENSVQEQLETETVEIEHKVENVNEITPKKSRKMVIVFSVFIVGLLILGVLNFLPSIQSFISDMQIEKEQQALQEKEKEQQALQAIEKELNIKLEKLEKIEWNSKGYVLNEKGRVTGFGCYDCEIKDLNRISAPLKGLSNLSTLELNLNKINDISLLEQLKNLISLSLHDNQISDISPLKNLSNLTKLYLGINQISNISPLKDLSKLNELYLFENEISDITALKGLRNLSRLNLSGNPIEELPVWITDFNMDIQWEEHGYKDIVLYDNPLKKPPVEIVKQGKEAIRQYFEQLETQDNEKLSNE